MLNLFAVPAAIVFGALAASWIVRRFPGRFCKSNFRGDRIPNSFGIAFVLAGIVYYGAQSVLQTPQRGVIFLLYVIAAAGFGGLGLADDLLGDRSTGGLKGHLKALLSGRVTTGAVKAIGGVALALVCGGVIHPGSWRMVLAALLIAGTANSLNLVDLRPGRCLTLFFAASLPVIAATIRMAAAGAGLSAFPFLFALLAAIVIFPNERRAKYMLGDCGSNSFGAALGLSYAIYLPDVRVQLAIGALILLLHAWTEGHSISKWIDSRPLLRRLDSKIGVR